MQHWNHVNNLPENIATCIGLLKKLSVPGGLKVEEDEDEPMDGTQSTLDYVAARLVRSRRRLVKNVRGLSLLANFEGSALGLNLLLRVRFLSSLTRNPLTFY